MVFIENRLLYGKQGPACRRRPHRPDRAGASCVAAGRDVTIVSLSRMVHESLAGRRRARRERHRGRGDRPAHRRAARLADGAGVSADAPDACSSRTRRSRTSASAPRSRLVSADEAFWSLDAPVRRVGAPFTPAPYAPLTGARVGAEQHGASSRRPAGSPPNEAAGSGNMARLRNRTAIGKVLQRGSWRKHEDPPDVARRLHRRPDHGQLADARASGTGCSWRRPWSPRRRAGAA